MNYQLASDQTLTRIVGKSRALGNFDLAEMPRGRFILDPLDHILPPRHISPPSRSAEFRRLADNWTQETAFTSSLHEKYLHPSYARIIGMGWPAVPLILARLQELPDDWFYALRAMTGEDPVNPEDAGDIERMTDAWLEWGGKQGLV